MVNIPMLNKIIYISGYGRSGSTLVESVLSACSGCVGIGEAHYLIERGVVENRRCSCGELFKDCQIWNTVIAKTLTEWRGGSIEDVMKLRNQVARLRFLPQILGVKYSENYEKKFNRYADFLALLYKNISLITGVEIIIDSSKDPVYLFVLQRIFKEQVCSVHIVRDSRAVAYSWQRVKSRSSAHGLTDLMPRNSLIKSVFYWILFNGLSDHGLKRSPGIRVRYEELTQFPEKVFKKIGMFCGIDSVDIENAIEGHNNKNMHSVSGNPMRYDTGPVVIKMDEEWKSKMPMRAQLVVKFMTYPLLKRYGYMPDK